MQGDISIVRGRRRLALVGEGLLFVTALGAVGAGAIAHYPRSSQEALEALPTTSLSRELPPPTTYFVVVSEARAAAFQAGIDEGNNVRHGVGLEPMRESVIAAADRPDAEHIVSAIQEGNRILAGFGTEDRAVIIDG